MPGRGYMHTHPILVIGSPSPYLDELNVIFRFIGQDIIVSSPEQLMTHLQGECQFLAVMICLDQDKSNYRDLLDRLAHTHSKLPSILIQIQPEFEVDKRITFVQTLPMAEQQLKKLVSECEQHHAQRQLEKSGLLIGRSVQMQQLRKLISQVATADVSVLLLGESGTGKELAAMSIHQLSKRAKQHFVPINCGAIPRELLESELFGHEKGAFTGAISARRGRFEIASGGTLFLDEIGDMPLAMQVKLLRVLQERVYERVGSAKSISADVRIVAATHVNLVQSVAEHKFREDLFYRLNVFPIELPALREHREDISELVMRLALRFRNHYQCELKFTPEAMMQLTQYAWPGNVRELSNLIERLMVLYPDQTITVNELPKQFCTLSHDLATENTIQTPMQTMASLPEGGLDLKKLLIETEQSLIKQALDECDGVVARAADRLQIRRTTLVEKMRKYGIRKFIEEDVLA